MLYYNGKTNALRKNFAIKNICLTLILLYSSACSATVTALTWEGLLPNLPKYEDPFLALQPAQLYDLATVARYQKKDSLNEIETQEYESLLAKFANDNIDVEYLFDNLKDVREYRQRLATQPKLSLNNQDISLAGFITPLEFNGVKVTKFFLVPSAGACIHTPAPPPNQIVIVDYPKGIELASLQQPFVIEGKLKIEQSDQEVGYADGLAVVDANYQMTAIKVEKYQ